MKIPIFQIKVNEGRREVDQEAVHELADSISKVGLLNAITVDQEHTLIAGLHRLEAAKLLGWTEIECNISSLEGLLAELAEIDENLIRRGLDCVEEGEQYVRRKEIYEMIHPETQRGKRNGQTSKTDPVSVLEVKSFAQDTAEKIGVSPRTIERKVQIEKKLTPETKEIVRSNDIGFRNALKLSRLPPVQQKEAANMLVTNKIHSVDEYQPTAERIPDAAPPNTEQKEPPSAASSSSPPEEGLSTTIRDYANDLKNPDRDRRGTPQTFLTSFLFTTRRFCHDMDAYAGTEYDAILPMLTQEHLEQLHQEIQSVHTSLDDLINEIERKASE